MLNSLENFRNYLENFPFISCVRPKFSREFHSNTADNCQPSAFSLLPSAFSLLCQSPVSLDSLRKDCNPFIYRCFVSLTVSNKALLKRCSICLIRTLFISHFVMSFRTELFPSLNQLQLYFHRCLLYFHTHISVEA